MKEKNKNQKRIHSLDVLDVMCGGEIYKLLDYNLYSHEKQAKLTAAKKNGLQKEEIKKLKRELRDIEQQRMALCKQIKERYLESEIEVRKTLHVITRPVRRLKTYSSYLDWMDSKIN